ncbi:MAG: hypothetical protein JWO30_1099 [Fibrobacteres bacterium]|nr:hypothetical protein [Fibrobacterota bacterium]
MMMFSRVGFRGNILCALLAAAAANLSAQTAATQITGTVKDAASHTAIAGAMVSLLSRPDLLAMTDADGAFSISLEDPSGVRAGTGPERAAIGFSGSELSFSTGKAGARVLVTLHDLRGTHLATLQDASLPQGDYALSAATASLPAGVYLVRAQVGSRVRSFKMSTLSTLSGFRPSASTAALRRKVSGNPEKAAGLSKAAAGGVDFLLVSKDGYLKKNHEVMAYADAQEVTLDVSKPATARLKIFSDSTMAQIDWANAAIYSWESTALLAVDSTNQGFNGSVATMKVSSGEFASWNGWAFHVAVLAGGLQPTADLTPYADGSLHLSVKGNAKSIGVMISSPNQGAGSAPLVDLGGKGYLPDSAWHEITIPMSEFAGTLDLSRVFVYAGFVSPSVQFSEFDPLATYMIDDVYYTPKP